MCIRDRGQGASDVGEVADAALGVKQCVAEGVGRARDRALGMQPLRAIGVELLIAIAADGGEHAGQRSLFIQDEVEAYLPSLHCFFAQRPCRRMYSWGINASGNSLSLSKTESHP